MQIEEGAILTGKVTGLTDFGAFVDLGEGKTGMIHISEVSASYVKNISDFLSVGQEVSVMVTGINEQGKISLSSKKAAQQSGEAKAEERPKTFERKRPERRQPNVWNGPKSSHTGEAQSFEDMMARFKQQSDEKIADLKRAGESKHGGGYSRRGGK